MSFILDALKKSESDRQRQSGPSLFEVKVAPPRRTLPIWAVAIAVLLGINVIVVSWMLFRRPASSPQPPSSAPQPAAPHDAPVARAAITPPTESSAAPSMQAPATAPAPAPTAATPPSLPQAATRAGAAAPPASRADQEATQPPAADNPADTEPAAEPAATPGFGTVGGTSPGDLPLYQQIVTSDGLPPLHLDLHVFADRPEDRFVMINMHRLGEGDTLSGVHVDAIRPDGVVLSYQGTQFLLPRN
jgi:general secretion pathway protein B